MFRTSLVSYQNEGALDPTPFRRAPRLVACYFVENVERMHPYQRGLASIMGLGSGKFIETERLVVVGVALAQLVCSQHGHLVTGVQVPSGNTRNETKPPPEAKRGRATGCVKEPSAARQRGKLFCDSRATLWETGWRTGTDPGTVHMAARNRRGYRRMGQNEIVRHALNN